MKRMLSAVLMLAMCVSLCACGSSPAQAMEIPTTEAMQHSSPD